MLCSRSPESPGQEQEWQGGMVSERGQRTGEAQGSASRVRPWRAPRPAARSPGPRPAEKGGTEGPQGDAAHCVAAGTRARPRARSLRRDGAEWDGEAPEETWQLGEEGSQRDPGPLGLERGHGPAAARGTHAPSVTHATGSTRTLCPPHRWGTEAQLSAAAPTRWLGAAWTPW